MKLTKEDKEIISKWTCTGLLDNVLDVEKRICISRSLEEVAQKILQGQAQYIEIENKIIELKEKGFFDK